MEFTVKGTPRKSGSKMTVLADRTIFGTIGGDQTEKSVQLECQKAIKQRKPTFLTYDFSGKKDQPICGGQIKVFIEPFIGQKSLIICGAGTYALPLSILAKMLNLKVIVIDRSNFQQI